MRGTSSDFSLTSSIPPSLAPSAGTKIDSSPADSPSQSAPSPRTPFVRTSPHSPRSGSAESSAPHPSRPAQETRVSARFQPCVIPARPRGRGKGAAERRLTMDCTNRIILLATPFPWNAGRTPNRWRSHAWRAVSSPNAEVQVRARRGFHCSGKVSHGRRTKGCTYVFQPPFPCFLIHFIEKLVVSRFSLFLR